jgi:hypothetical protein
MNIKTLFSLEGGTKRIVFSPRMKQICNSLIGGSSTTYWSRGSCESLPKDDGKLYFTQIFGNYFWVVATTCCSTTGEDLCWVDPNDINMNL